MLDTDFDDFLDSDDDALFAEVSNNLIEHDLPLSETTEILKRSVIQNEPKTTLYESSQKLDKNILQDKKESKIIKSPSKEETSYHSKLQDSSPFYSTSTKLDHDLLVPADNAVKNKTTFTPPVKSCASSELLSNENSVSGASSYINNRFTPGYTPKAKKRKLPGPAGLLELYNESEETESADSHKIQTMDIELENIMSSQFTPEHLTLSSWQKLQTAVSSCSTLHSRANYYSIKRVLKESSKKKLPKHMIVPILCVLLKKITYKDSAIISVFMDDTGEINGKIDADVISTYKEYIVEGSTFILKKVTFLCNMLLLKVENLVSIYHPDGAEKHAQTLESILETSEPLKPMKCECPKLSDHNVKSSMNGIAKDIDISHKLDCISHSSDKLINISNQTRMVNNSINNLNPNPSSMANKLHIPLQKMRSDEFLENLLDDGNSVDEFDELMGNLDEKSFMEDL